MFDARLWWRSRSSTAAVCPHLEMRWKTGKDCSGTDVDRALRTNRSSGVDSATYCTVLYPRQLHDAAPPHMASMDRILGEDHHPG
nr:hypothetical protein CFP56_01236 [Quercus suber]